MAAALPTGAADFYRVAEAVAGRDGIPGVVAWATRKSEGLMYEGWPEEVKISRC